jgi:LmbE family N-acetylglucosaminyl deacetylase
MTTLLCIIAHPDDETMLCGGTLAALAAHGLDIHVLCATRGEGGELGEPPVCTREELGRVREAEMRCACQKLGARQVTFLDYVDPLVGPEDSLSPFTDDEGDLRDRLLAHMRGLCPDIVLTHGRDGEYGHPAHKLLHRAAWAAFQQMLPQSNGATCFYTVAAAIPGLYDRLFNDSEPADLIYALEGTPWLDAKEAAALCHVTQHALFKRRKKARTVREVLRRIEGLHRYWPADGSDAPAFADARPPVATPDE